MIISDNYDRAHIEEWVKCLMSDRPLAENTLLYRREMIEKLLAAKPHKDALEVALWHFKARDLWPSAEEVLAWCEQPIPEKKRWLRVAFVAAAIPGLPPIQEAGFLKALLEDCFYDVPDDEVPCGDGVREAAIAVKMLLRMLVDNRDHPEKQRKFREAMAPAVMWILDGEPPLTTPPAA
jgi:hypothetical protein